MKLACLPLVAAAATGCFHEEPRQHIERAANPTFTLYVSNQSFDIDPVDIEVRLDGRLAVTGDFDVGSQHSFFDFDFHLEPGSHVITARGDGGDIDLEQTFTLGADRKWGTLFFWYYGPDHYEPTPRSLDFDLYDTAPAFD
jgi:hypothetical protein